MLSTDPEDLNRLASVHSVSSCEEKPSYPFPRFRHLCDGSIGLMIPFSLFPRPVPGVYPDRHIICHPRDCSLGSGSLGTLLTSLGEVEKKQLLNPHLSLLLD